MEMGDEKSMIKLTSVNTGISNSILEVMANLDKFNARYLASPEIAKLSEKIQKMTEPLTEPLAKFQYQLQSYSSIFKSMEYPIAYQQAEAIKKISQIQSIPFTEIAVKLNSSFEKLRFLEFDLFDNIENEEPAASPIIITEINNVKEIIRQIYKDNQFLYQLEARKFEEVIAELLFNKGFEVELTKQTRDNGYDILALYNVNGFSNKYLVECKRNAPTRPIGIGIIRSFCDVIKEEKANKGIIFTTSYFSIPSKERKNQEGHLLDFKDRDDIIEWVKDYLKI